MFRCELCQVEAPHEVPAISGFGGAALGYGHDDGSLHHEAEDLRRKSSETYVQNQPTTTCLPGVVSELRVCLRLLALQVWCVAGGSGGAGAAEGNAAREGAGGSQGCD